MSLELTHELDAALFYLFFDAEGLRAISAGTLDLVLYRFEVFVVLVVRVGELSDPLGAGPVEDDGNLVVLFLELLG